MGKRISGLGKFAWIVAILSIILALVSVFMAAYFTMIAFVLLLLGIFTGFVAVSKGDRNQVMVAGLVLVVIASAGIFAPIPFIGNIVDSFLIAWLFYIAPVAIIPAIITLYERVKK